MPGSSCLIHPQHSCPISFRSGSSTLQVRTTSQGRWRARWFPFAAVAGSFPPWSLGPTAPQPCGRCLDDKFLQRIGALMRRLRTGTLQDWAAAPTLASVPFTLALRTSAGPSLRRSGPSLLSPSLLPVRSVVVGKGRIGRWVGRSCWGLVWHGWPSTYREASMPRGLSPTLDNGHKSLSLGACVARSPSQRLSFSRKGVCRPTPPSASRDVVVAGPAHRRHHRGDPASALEGSPQLPGLQGVWHPEARVRSEAGCQGVRE